MSEQLLQVKNLVVNVEDTEILHGIDLEINRGETHVLMGPNGAGKSTLGYALMGSPRYQLTNGQIWFKGQDNPQTSVRRLVCFYRSRTRWRFPVLPSGTF